MAAVDGKMNMEIADQDLVGSYARDGSETAFRALVARHVDLVFGAALRQTGDAGLAEEVTQNVFIALARKAPRLAGHETLAGWLHRTAILEAKARLRAELRRQRREHVAAALEERRREGRDPAEDLAPLLDEGLLRLRDSDRLVLILRYLEERSLREVGDALGIAEDSARKRVDRALERLAAYFRAQGFALPAGVAATLVRASSASAAPAGLAMASANAGLGAAAPSGLAALLGVSALQLAHLQTAGLCALLVATPLGWRWAQDRNLEPLEQALVQRKFELEAQLGDASAMTRQIRAQLVQAGADAFNLRTRQSVAASTSPESGGRYRWDDSAALARIPKELLQHFWVPAVVDREGTLTPEIQALLQMTPAESAAVQDALHKFSRAAESAQAARTRPVNPSGEELEGRPPSEVRVFEARDFGQTFTSLTQNLTDEIAQALGPERATLLRGPLSDWIPIGDRANGLSSSWAFMSGDYRIRFLNEVSEADGEPWIACRIHKDSGSVLYPMPAKNIPAHLRAQLQDWLTIPKRTSPAPGPDPSTIEPRP